MKHLFRLTFFASAIALVACASHQPKPKSSSSSWRIIDADDDHNPFISDNPSHAGEIIKDETRSR